MPRHDLLRHARRMASRARLSAAAAATTAAAALALPALAQTLPTVDVQDAPSAIDAQTRSYGREELARYGDATLSDILRRLPGITLDADGRLLLRGMGGGYTQVLLNGRPLSMQGNGPILDGLGAEVIERIEIVRGSTATDSGEGVAGTVRIVTREAHGERIRRARVEGGRTQGGSTGLLALELGDRLGDVDWIVSGRWRNEHTDIRRLTESMGSAADGSTYYLDRTRLDTAERRRDFVTQGALAWRATAQDQLTLQWLGELGASRKHTPGVLQHDAPWPAPYATSLTRDDEPRFWHLEPQLRWQHRLADGGTWTVDASQSRSGSRSQWDTATFDGAGELLNQSDWRGSSRERSQRVGLKWEQPLAAGWRWAAGTELLRERYREDALSDDEPESSRLRRRAVSLFGQVQWSPAADWRMEAGLRRERRHIDSGDAENARQRQNADHLWLPSINATWHETADRSWHAGLARSYRQPRLRDLSPGGRSTGDANQPFFPDMRGNPALRAETSTGAELGLRQAWGRATPQEERPGELRLGLFARHIQDAITRRLFQDDDGRWVVAPFNIGRNRVLGAEAEVRWDMDKLAPDHPWRAPVVLRADLTLTRSRVASNSPGVPARLVGQSPVVLGVGFDAGSRRWPALTWGATLRAEAGYTSQPNTVGHLRTRPLATLDAYALWKVDAATRLRLRTTQWGSDWRTRLTTPLHESGSQQLDTVRLSRPWTVALSLERDF